MKRIIARLIGGTGLILALLTLTNCDNADNPAEDAAIQELLETVNGHWYVELPMSGETENWRTEEEGDMTAYDHIGAIIYLNGNFNDASYWGYLYLQDGDMVNFDGLHRRDDEANFDFTIDREGNITPSSHLQDAPQVSNMRYANGVITADVTYKDRSFSLTFHKVELDEQEQLKAFYEILEDEGIVGGGYTDLDDQQWTDIVNNGADKPARSRQQ